MTRVDFYLLADHPEGGRELAVCKLAHKAFRLRHRVYIYTPDESRARDLDRLLWTFSAGSFLPHGLHLSHQGEDARVPVLIGSQTPPAGWSDVLVSLAPQVPDFFNAFERVADIVGSTDEERRQARERFRFYRDRGCPPTTHNL